jgi:hypothetical protein
MDLNNNEEAWARDDFSDGQDERWRDSQFNNTEFLMSVLKKYERGEQGRKPNGVRHKFLIAELARRKLGVE